MSQLTFSFVLMEEWYNWGSLHPQLLISSEAEGGSFKLFKKGGRKCARMPSVRHRSGTPGDLPSRTTPMLLPFEPRHFVTGRSAERLNRFCWKFPR